MDGADVKLEAMDAVLYSITASHHVLSGLHPSLPEGTSWLSDVVVAFPRGDRGHLLWIILVL
jgi:hypothetical protein